MSKLRENIDRILGNSIRCLLPSYWWKRIFGLVVDEVEDVRKVANSKANKSVVDEVDALSKRVDTIINSGNNIFPDMPSNAMSLIQSVEAGTFEPRASGGSATTSYKIYKDLNAFIAVIGSHLYIYDLAAGDFKGVTFLGGIYLQTNNELTKLSNAIHYNLVLGDWILGADCFMLDANTGDSYGVTYGNGSVFSFTYEKNGYEYTDRLNPDGTLENISFNKPKSTPTFLLYYPYTTINDVYTMHESFIEHNATELPKIKNSINNKEGYILNVVAAGTSATDVLTMQDVDFHYLGYGTGNTGGLVVITSQLIPIYRAVQPNRLFLGFKEDGSCEVKEIAVGDTLYLYYSEGYGFNFTDAEKAANAENIIPIWNSLDESFTPRPIIIRHKVNDTPTGSGNYLSIPAVLTGVDTTGTNITLVGCFSPGRFLEYQYNRTTGEFVSLKEITIEGGEGSYDDTGIKKDIADLQAKDTQHDAKLAELSEENERLRERIEEQDQFIEDLQNTKIDRENDDYYPKMAVGLADNLAGVDVVDSKINFRRSGGGAISDGVARIESIKGNSVVWNQVFKPNITTPTMNGVAYAIKDDAVIMTGVATDSSYIQVCDSKVFINEHKYALTGGFTSGNSLDTYMLAINKGGSYSDIASPNVVFVAEADKTNRLFIRIAKGVDTNGFTVRPKLYDLTQMFGSGNEPTTIEEFYARIPMGVDLNAYNEGEVIHMNVQSIESVGVNQWDEEWEMGGLSANGLPVEATNRIRSKNFIPVVPYKAYYVSKALIMFYYDINHNIISYEAIDAGAPPIPSNCYYIKFYEYGVTTYKGDICVNLSDTSINGKYFPYIKRVEDLSIIRKYFPQGMKSAGTAHDEIRYNKASGKWEKVEAIGIRAYQEGDADNASYLTDGKVTCYPLAEPIVTELDAEDQFKDLDYKVWNAGTEKAIAEGKSAPLAADITYGFNAIGKIKELESLVAALRAKVGI